MPWKIIKRNKKWCIYKEGKDGLPVGKTLGCHDTEQGAKDQLSALYVNAPRSRFVYIPRKK